MVAIQLAPDAEAQLAAIAAAAGQTADQYARRIVEDFLELSNLTNVSDADWAEASVQLAPEIFESESWDQGTTDATR